MRSTPLLVFLTSLTLAWPAMGKIERHGETVPSASRPGGIKLSGTPSRQACWLDGRPIFDETDPFLMSFGLSGQPGMIVTQAPDGSRRQTAVTGRLPSACFATGRR